MLEIIICSQLVYFSTNVLDVFNAFKQNTKKKNEAGGILLGQIVNGSLYVLYASTPNKFDIASRTSFIRNKDAAQIIIDYEFNNSGGKTIYLGEWHTHYQDNPIPSPQDIDMINEQYKINILNSKQILLVIKGINKSYIGIYDGNEILSFKTTF